MKNISELSTKKEVISRLKSISVDDSPLWGKMNSNEMLCHCADQIKLAEGIITSKFIGNVFLTTLMKWLILIGLPTPKGKIETTPELKQGLGGSKPTEFENDRNMLIDNIEKYSIERKAETTVHPAFGKMNNSQWARLIFLHLDHHLRQFGK